MALAPRSGERVAKPGEGSPEVVPPVRLERFSVRRTPPSDATIAYAGPLDQRAERLPSSRFANDEFAKRS